MQGKNLSSVVADVGDRPAGSYKWHLRPAAEEVGRGISWRWQWYLGSQMYQRKLVAKHCCKWLEGALLKGSKHRC